MQGIRWEYHTTQNNEWQFNNLGYDGWELVGVVQEAPYSFKFFWKRPL